MDKPGKSEFFILFLREILKTVSISNRLRSPLIMPPALSGTQRLINRAVIPAVRQAAAMPGTAFRPETINFLDNAGIRLSITQDLRPKALADARINEGISNFDALFGTRGRHLAGREIVNWNLATPHSIPDAQTTLHVIYLYDKEGASGDKDIKMNLCDPDDTLSYIANGYSLLYRFIKGRGFPGVSFHVGYSSPRVQRLDYTDENGRSNHIQVPVPGGDTLDESSLMSRMTQCLEHFKANLRASGFNGFIAAENNNFETWNGLNAYEHITSPEFIGGLADATSLDLLLDTSHLMVACGNKWKTDPADYVEKLLRGRRDRLKEVHLSVPSVRSGNADNRFMDSHSSFYDTLGTGTLTNKTLEILFDIVRNKRTGQPLILNFETDIETAALDAVAVVTYLQAMDLAK